ncbi:unnamed protein product, partial [Medioppia subpectinata]
MATGGPITDIVSDGENPTDNNIPRVIDQSILAQLTDENKIGKGTYAIVYKIKVDSNEYAFKIARATISRFADSPEPVKLSADENKEKEARIVQQMLALQTLHKLDNKNLVKCVKSWLTEANMCIQMELCQCTLPPLLASKLTLFGRVNHMAPRNTYPYSEICDLEYFICAHMCEEIVRGLNYLHSQSPPIFHRDIKHANMYMAILPDGEAVLKVGDYALAPLQECTAQTNTKGVGIYTYLAPEICTPPGVTAKYTPPSDLYSMGMIIPELFNFNYTIKQESKRMEYLQDTMVGLIETKMPNRTKMNVLLKQIEGFFKLVDTQTILSQYAEYNDRLMATGNE